jgi:hypothetical protein
MPVQGLHVTSRLTAQLPGALTLGRKKWQSTTEPPRRASGDRAQDVQVADEGLSAVRVRREVVWRALRLLVHPQDQQGIREHQLPDLRGTR